MQSTSKGENSGPYKLFREWYSGWGATRQRKFVKKLYREARYRVRSQEAEDVAQDAMDALWRSSTLYPEVDDWLGILKVSELARLYWARQRARGEVTDAVTDALADPGDDPLESMVKREDAHECEQAVKSSLTRVRQAGSLKHKDWIGSVLALDENLPPDEAEKIFRHGPLKIELNNQKIARHHLPAELVPEIELIERRLAEIRKIAKADFTKELAAETAQLKKRHAKIMKRPIIEAENIAEALRRRLRRRGISGSGIPA